MHPLRAPRALVPLLLGALLAACTASGSPTATGTAPPGASEPVSGGDYPGWPAGPPADATIVPLVVSSQLAVGPNRFLFTLYDAQDQTKLVAAPDVTADLAFYDLRKDPGAPAATSSGTFFWAVSGQRGLYRASATFPEAGDWGVQVTVHRPGQADGTARVRFDVLDASTTPAIGAAVPAVDTPTATMAADIARISTDPHPDPAFYRQSIAQALAAGRPFVVVFATPQFCQSQICGPTLDTVKALAGPFESKVTFIHVEPYLLQAAPTGGLQPAFDQNGQLQLVPAMEQWGLPSEPWVFVVGADGKLAAKFEGAVGSDELTAALRVVAGT